MKIGIDCRLWSETGIGRYTRNLVLNLQVLDRKNQYVLLALSKDKQEISGQIKNCNFGIVNADIKWHTLEEQIKFPQILSNENLDLVHFPYFSVPIFYNRPFVITIHDLIINHFPTGNASMLPVPVYDLKRLAYKFILSKAAKNAKKIIAVSNATKQEIVDHLGIVREKIIVIYEGVDEKISSQKLHNAKYFLYVGNAYPHKNLDRLLDAFKILNLDVNLILVGKKDYFYERLMEKVNKMDLSKKITLMTNVGDEQLAGLYRNAIALVLPSLMEGFGLPALEAMASKCLVLASNTPSLKEVCGDAAIYFNPQDVHDIAEKMKKVLSKDIKGDKKAEGFERSKLFSWRKMAKETLSIYEMSMMQASGK